MESPTETQTCITCLSPKIRLKCGICEGALCKSCSIFHEDTTFTDWPEVPKVLSQAPFCHSCYEEKVRAVYEECLAIHERAKDLSIYDIKQGKETRLMKRLEAALKVESSDDREETLMRLAYLAAKAGFNCLIDVDLVSEKIRDGTYQTTKWSGSGIPTERKR